MNRFSYEFIPVQKEIVNNKTYMKKYSPFIGFGISMMPSISLNSGVIIEDSWGFGIIGQYNINKWGIENLPNYDIGLYVLKKF